MELLRIPTLLALVLLAGNCTAPPTPSGSSDRPYPDRIAPKPPSSFDDSLTVVSPSAVFFRPDSIQLDKIKAVNTKTVFANLIHDGYYQMQNATQVIQRYWPRIKIVETDTHRWLVFKNKNGALQSIDLNTIGDICGIYLFDGTKAPIRVDMPNIDTQLWFYFGSGLKGGDSKR